MRAPHIPPLWPIIAGLCMAFAAQAQHAPDPAAAPTREASPADRSHQRVQHIHIEDAGSRVDEVRAGGETRQITVQPKAPVPAYDVRPADATGNDSRESGPGGAGRRVWKLHQF